MGMIYPGSFDSDLLDSYLFASDLFETDFFAMGSDGNHFHSSSHDDATNQP